MAVIDQLEAFHPDRIANRILGMGDVVSLVEKVAEDTDRDFWMTAQEAKEYGIVDEVLIQRELADKK